MLLGQQRGSAARAYLQCANCGDTFGPRLLSNVRNTVRVYCSNECRLADMINISTRVVVEATCENCGTVFSLPNIPRKPHLIRRFCSQACRYTSRRRYGSAEELLEARRAAVRRRKVLRRANGGSALPHHTEAEWKDLLQRCKGRCARCRRRSKELQRDHVIALTKGGSDHITNIQPLCSRCNRSKSNRRDRLL
jgi:5-methylcytosine-specific restriction endonuclease McrA